MKNEKGVTLAALVVYVIVFSVTIALLSSLSSYVFGNLNNINSNAISSEEFNKFNVHFVNDVKKSASVEIENNSAGNLEITFENGNKYTFVLKERAIYKNKEKIARNILNLTASKRVENSKNIIEVSISTGNNESKPTFNKTIKYVLKYW